MATAWETLDLPDPLGPSMAIVTGSLLTASTLTAGRSGAPARAGGPYRSRTHAIPEYGMAQPCLRLDAASCKPLQAGGPVQPSDLLLGQRTGPAGAQLGQAHRADLDPGQRQDRVAHLLQQPADDVLAALVQH